MPRALVESLERQGMQLWADGDRIRFRGPAAALTPEAREALQRMKPAVLRLLTEPREYPLSHPQRALWFLHQAETSGAAYNVAFTVRIRSAVDARAMADAFQKLVDRHPLLRTTYELRDGEVIQRVHPRMHADFLAVDLPGATLEDIRERAVTDIRRRFDLTEGPLLRARLYRRASDDQVLLFTAPHITADGWSVWLILDELRHLYPAARAGTSAELPPVPYRYVDFVAWQEELLTSAEGQRLREYWERRLPDDAEPLELPLDHDRPALFRFAGDVCSFSLGAELTAAARALARQEGVTLFTLFLAAYQTLLHRYTGQRHIRVGTPTTGRTRPEFAPVLGCFVNSVTHAADFDGTECFRSFLRTTHESVLGALSHQDYPLALLNQKLRSRDASRSTGFQADFVFQKPQASRDIVRLLEGLPIDFAGLRMEEFKVPQQVGQLDLTLEMIEGPAEIVADFKYHTDLFEAATVERMSGHFRTLLRAAIQDPDLPLDRLPLLSDAERAAVLRCGQGPQVELPAGTLLDRFEAALARDPAHPAVVVPGAAVRRTLSYEHLSHEAERVRAALDAAGASERVAYCLSPSERSVATVLGIWKSGRTAVPLDPAQPRERIAQILAEATPRVVVCEAAVRAMLPENGPRLLLWEELEATTGSGPQAPAPLTRARPEDLAYVIFTSGSTGRPKGVEVSHGNLLNAMLGWEIDYELRAGDVHLQMAAPAFDVWMGDLARALGTGGTLVICPRDWLLVPEQLAEVIEHEGVSVAEFVPAVLRELRGFLAAQGRRLASLRLVACGSDQWYQGEAVGFRDILPEGCRFINSYGVTEATIDSSWFELRQAAAENAERQVPIGRSFANVRMYVLDHRLEPVPYGVVGELCIGGAGVARGYLDRPELSAERFLPDPHLPGGRVYRTGDLARLRPDGNFELVGRADAQVKIRGNRVELGEIEARLTEHPSVRAAVAVFERGGGDRAGRLGAFVVPAEGCRVDVAELGTFLRERLPAYMVPAPIHLIEQVPLSANGKVNRKALPPLAAGGTTPGLDTTPPRTATEAVLCELWRQVLDLEGDIGVHADFFQLGGHSLLGTRMIWMIGERLDVKLPFHAIFEAPTIALLAQRVDATRLLVAAPPASAAASESFEF